MCDYSLMHVANRPAKVGDKIVSTNFLGTITHGFADVENTHTAVCLLPGTEIGFEREVTYHDGAAGLSTVKVAPATATFCQVDKDKPHVHHDALQFADGKVVLLTSLCQGQHATVLQMPVDIAKAQAEAAAIPQEGTAPVNPYPNDVITVTESSPADLVAI